MIEVSHLTKQYGNHLAVDDVSFTVADGQICGLLGPNGAGKSTIMNILTGYLSATSGQVTVAGHPLPEEADAAKACVGYLPEQPPLYPEMTVQEYLNFMYDLKKVKLPREKHIREICSLTKIQNVYKRLIGNLSKGYRQRVGIAQALLGNPPVLILDEATSSIDTRTEALIEKGMDQLMEGRTVFVIAHRLSTVRNAAAIMVLEHGRIVERGSHDDLLEQQGEYYQLYHGMFELS